MNLYFFKANYKGDTLKKPSVLKLGHKYTRKNGIKIANRNTKLKKSVLKRGHKNI